MLGLLAVAAILTRPSDPLPPDTPAAAAAIAADLAAHPDAATRAASHVARRGRILAIGAVRLVDEGVCDGSGCERYRFDRLWTGGFAGVVFERDEGSDYLMVGDGRTTALGARPVASPDGRTLFVGFRDDLDGNSATGIPDSIALWRAADLQRLILIDTAVLAAYPPFVAWHGSDCVEFAGVPEGAALNASRSYWLARSSTGWALNDSRPPGCPER